MILGQLTPPFIETLLNVTSIKRKGTFFQNVLNDEINKHCNSLSLLVNKQTNKC